MPTQTSNTETVTATQLGVLLAIFIGCVLLIVQHHSDYYDELFYFSFLFAAVYYVLAEYELEDTAAHIPFQSLAWAPTFGPLKTMVAMLKDKPLIRSCTALRLANFEFGYRVLLATLFGVIIAYPSTWMFGINETLFRFLMMAGIHWLMLLWDFIIIVGAGQPDLVQKRTIILDCAGLSGILLSVIFYHLGWPHGAEITIMVLLFFYLIGGAQTGVRVLNIMKNRKQLR